MKTHYPALGRVTGGVIALLAGALVLLPAPGVLRGALVATAGFGLVFAFTGCPRRALRLTWPLFLILPLIGARWTP